MNDLGKLLRETRIQKGIDYDEVVNAIRIRERLIKALENNDKGVFTAEIYYRAFMRSYAEFLGLDADALIAAYDEQKKAGDASSGDPNQNKNKNEDSANFYRDEKAFFINRKFSKIMGGKEPKFKKVLLSIISVIVVLAAVVFFALRDFNSQEELVNENDGNNGALVESYDSENVLRTEPIPDAPQQPVSPPAQNPRNAAPQAPSASAPAQSPNSVLPSNMAITIPVQRPPQTAPNTAAQNQISIAQNAPAVGQGSQVLTITALDNVWLRVDADGAMAFDGIMALGATRVWRANDRFRIRVGYARAIRVNFNGRNVDPTVGARDDVNTIILNRER
ncbi:MAG: DUF4115 domain-containing protein [Elusimicrobiota bacterium]|jgi:cytoskeleton protein RodZ|nr:DUF4115 domain-containing protein [Elusimicrobiota bacterium]